MGKLSIIILSYNVEKLLLNCLTSLTKSKTRNDNWEIIVVDNYSSDHSVQMVKKAFPEIKVIENEKNLGFAAGNNRGVEKSTSEYILFLNPDTIVYPDTVQQVLKFLEANERVGAATCRVELPDGSLDYSSHRGFPTPWNALSYFTGLTKVFPKSKFFAGYTATNKDMNIIHEIDVLTGAFAMVNKKAGDQVGWFDEDYFWNGEDIDFCYKLKKEGWKIFFLPSVKITHFKGSSSGLKKTGAGNVSKNTKTKSVLSSTEVMTIFYRKHLASKHPIFVNWLVYLGIYLLRTIRIIRSKL